MILADLSVTPHIAQTWVDGSQRSGGGCVCPGTLCDMFCAHGSWKQNRCSACKSYRQALTSVMSAWWEPPAYLHMFLVAAVFQLAEYEPNGNNNCALKIDLNFRDPEPGG